MICCVIFPDYGRRSPS